MKHPPIFDPSPTCAARRLNLQEEHVMSNKVKRAAANTSIVAGVLGAIVAVVAITGQLSQIAGRKWI